jgi:hypothetical protein
MSNATFEKSHSWNSSYPSLASIALAGQNYLKTSYMTYTFLPLQHNRKNTSISTYSYEVPVTQTQVWINFIQVSVLTSSLVVWSVQITSTSTCTRINQS